MPCRLKLCDVKQSRPSIALPIFAGHSESKRNPAELDPAQQAKLNKAQSNPAVLCVSEHN
jgi:triosephosphate isomerase